LRPKAFLVGVAALDDEAAEALRCARGEVVAHGSAEVVQVQEKALHAEAVEQRFDRPRAAREGVLELVDRGRGGHAEPGQVGGDDVRDLGQHGHDVAERVRGTREPVQQQHCRAFR
jgi:hypothetical protein